MKRGTSLSRAERAGEWALRLIGSGAVWYLLGPSDAAVYFAVHLLVSVRRPHFVDVGRFTAGVFLVSRRNYPPGFAIGFTRYGPEAEAKRSGLQVIVGKVSLMACAIVPHDEWMEFQRRKAERHAKRQGGAQ